MLSGVISGVFIVVAVLSNLHPLCRNVLGHFGHLSVTEHVFTPFDRSDVQSERFTVFTVSLHGVCCGISVASPILVSFA